MRRIDGWGSPRPAYGLAIELVSNCVPRILRKQGLVIIYVGNYSINSRHMSPRFARGQVLAVGSIPCTHRAVPRVLYKALPYTIRSDWDITYILLRQITDSLYENRRQARIRQRLSSSQD